INVLPLLGRLARTYGEEVIELPTADGEVEIDRATFVANLDNALKTAADLAKADRQAGGRLARPITLLREAAAKVTRAQRTFLEVADDVDFDRVALEEKFAALQQVVESLEQTL